MATPDLGQPASYLVLERGTPVYANDGEHLGQVAEVRADEGEDIFDGIAIEPMDRGGTRYVVAAQVDEIYERGVVLTVDAEGAASLPSPD